MRACSLNVGHVLSFRSRNIVIPASHFDAILSKKTKTEAAFEGAPLSLLSGSARGKVIESVVRDIDLELHPGEKVNDALLGFCVNGSKRSSSQAGYDWLRGMVRVECKSSQLQWRDDRWCFKFVGIKIAHGVDRLHSAFDELLLCFYTPQKIHIYEHDLRLGLGTNGRETEHGGHAVNIVGPRSATAWRCAVEAILGKLDADGNSCKKLYELSLDDNRIRKVADQFWQRATLRDYDGVPLSGISPSARGLRIQDIAREIDELSHPKSNFQDPVPSSRRVNGARRGVNQAEYDWLRDGRRVECKSGQLQWNTSSLRWLFRVINVSLEAVDDLLLALYTPGGIYFYKYSLLTCTGMSTTGLRSHTSGQQIQIFGPRQERDWRVALDVILQVLQKSGSRQIAIVTW